MRRFVMISFLVLLMGIFAFKHYIHSEYILSQNLRQFQEWGKTASVEECLDHLLTWRTHCSAMKGLCDMSTPRMFQACFNTQDRTEYCKTIMDVSSDTRFGYKACHERGLSRPLQKACATAFRVIDGQCKK